MDDLNKKNPQTTIEVVGCGPLKIKGNFLLKDLKRDSEAAPGEVLLCRCGKSTTKPFCDESHKR